MLRALRHRNYQLFFFGQGTSLIGTWMQRIALSWLVYRITGSALMLGVVGFAGQILTFAVAPFAGVLADRVNRRGLLVATQTVAMVQAFLLAALTLSGLIHVWHIVALSTMLGLVNAFDIPIRQSFVVEMLESRDDLPNAIALNSFMVNGAKMAGPSLAGILVAAIGEGWCFVLNGLSFVAVIAALLAMTVKGRAVQAQRKHVLRHLKDGLDYAFGSPAIRQILLLLAMVSLLGMPYTTLMPVFAKLLQGGSRTLGFLMAATGVGALGGALFLASRKSARGLGRAMPVATVLFGSALIAFCLSKSFYLSLAFLAAAGCGGMVQLAASNTLLQTIVDDDKRGRVMSFYTMAFMGMGPFGNLLAGWLAARFGAPVALIMGGVGCLVAAAIFASRLPVVARAVHRACLRHERASQPAAPGGNGGGDITPLAAAEAVNRPAY